MSTNRNTKGQIAQKTAPTQLDRIEDRFVSVIEGLSKDSSAIHDKLDQIQRDIDLLKSGSSFLQKAEEGIDAGDIHVVIPEEPKAEPWKPKSGERVVVLDGRGVKVKYNPGWVSDLTEMIGRIVEVVPSTDHRFVRVKETIMDFAVEWLRPATPEEIAEAERQEKLEKLEKLVRGCRVDTPDGEGIYLGRDAAAEGHYPYWVSLDRGAGVLSTDCFNLDQLTPLT